MQYNNDNPKVSLIISNFNGKEMLKSCLTSLEKLEYPNYEVIVVDAGSNDGTQKMVESEFPWVILIKEKRIGVGEAINKGIRKSKGQILAFDLNNDEVFSKEWLCEMVNTLLSNKNIIVGGTRVLYGSDIIDAAGGKINIFAWGYIYWRNRKLSELPKKPKKVDYTGLPLFNRELLDKIGLLDEKYFMYTEDLDFCERARKIGYKVLNVPLAVSYHRRGSARMPIRAFYFQKRNRIRFIIKYFSIPRLMISLIFWSYIMLINLIRFFPPLISILQFVGISSLSSKSANEYFKSLIDGLYWNIKNMKDHYYARLNVKRIVRENILKVTSQTQVPYRMKG